MSTVGGSPEDSPKFLSLVWWLWIVFCLEWLVGLGGDGRFLGRRRRSRLGCVGGLRLLCWRHLDRGR